MATRAHLVLPEELLRNVDQVAGKRQRSRFVETAIREKLAAERLSAALEATAGALDPADYPEWSTPEAVLDWIRESRQHDDERLAQKQRTRAT